MNADKFLNTSDAVKKLAKADYFAAQDLASELTNKVIVDQFEINMFAAALYAAVQAGTADESLYRQYCEAFPDANAGQFIGNN